MGEERAEAIRRNEIGPRIPIRWILSFLTSRFQPAIQDLWDTVEAIEADKSSPTPRGAWPEVKIEDDRIVELELEGCSMCLHAFFEASTSCRQRLAG